MNPRKQLIREITLSLLKDAKKIGDGAATFTVLEPSVLTEALNRSNEPNRITPLNSMARFPEEDRQIFREVFWDLFREGIITLGKDSVNAEFPWFKIHSEAQL